MSHSSVPQMIIDLLKANAIIADKVSDRIHYQTLPQSSQYPHIYFARQNEDSETLLDGSSGTTEDSYVFELIDVAFDDELVTAIKEAIEYDGFDYGGLTIFTSNITSVSDDYLFRSADSDALFMNALVLTIYLCEND